MSRHAAILAVILDQQIERSDLGIRRYWSVRPNHSFKFSLTVRQIILGQYASARAQVEGLRPIWKAKAQDRGCRRDFPPLQERNRSKLGGELTCSWWDQSQDWLSCQGGWKVCRCHDSKVSQDLQRSSFGELVYKCPHILD